MNILITGANGFLGSTIVRHALASQISFRATDLQKTPAISGINYDPSDITNPSTLKHVLKGITGVIHAAGLAHIFDDTQAKDAPFYSVNVMGTVNMINAAVLAGVQHFVLISSVSVYGPFTQGVYDEGVSCNPVGPYALSKYNAEQRAQEIAKNAGITLTILRLATLYGEDDPGNVGRLIRSLDQGRFIWIGDGSNRKSLLYKGDAARACMMVALAPDSGIRVFNVSGPPCTVREIVDTIGEVLGRRPMPGRVPASVAMGLSRMLSLLPVKRVKGVHTTVKKWLAEDVYDTRRFEKTFGFRPEVGVEEGLRREVAWYREVRRLRSADYAD